MLFDAPTGEKVVNLDSLYSILIGLGATLGLWRLYSRCEPPQRNKYLGIGIWALCGGLLGARTGFVLTHLHYFSIHRDALAKFWLGGLNGFGAIAGSILFILIAARILHLRPLKALDLMSSLVLPLGVMAWLGGWAVGSAYGPTLAPGTWWGMMIIDETGLSSLRVPLQPIASITLFIVISIVERKTGNMGYGFMFGWVGLTLSLHTLVFSWLRADAVQILFGLRLDVWLALLSTAGFAIFIIILYKKTAKEDKMKRRNPTQEVAA